MRENKISNQELAEKLEKTEKKYKNIKEENARMDK